jgi:hypothetical protein
MIMNLRCTTLVLYITGLVFYIGVVVAAVVAVGAVSLSLSGANTIIEDARNANKSQPIAEYAADVKNYGHIAVSRKSPEMRLRVPRRESAPEDICGLTLLSPGWESGLLKSTITREGGLDPYLPNYRIFYTRLPLERDEGIPHQASLLFTEESPGNPPRICYGSHVTPASFDEGAAEKDVCQFEITATKCAPGWSTGDAKKYLCKLWEQCIADVTSEQEDREKDEKKRYPRLGAIQHNNQWLLPKGWKAIDDLKWYLQILSDETLAPDFEGMPLSGSGLLGTGVYYAVHLFFSIIGILGAVFLIIGLIVTCLCKG